ncbi:MAG: PucC family protein, partial [Pseudomonadota bacterium]
LGGFMGTVIIDIVRWASGDIALSFASVFTIEAVLFLASALIATRIRCAITDAPTRPTTAAVSNPFQVQPAE